MSTRIIQALIALFILCVSQISTAKIITFEFEGAVVSSNKPASFPIGQPVIGRFSFESTIVDTNPGNTEQGVYDNVIYFTFTSGSIAGIASSSTAGGSFVESIIVNRNSVFDPQRYEVFSPCWNTPNNNCRVEINGEELRRMIILLQGDNGAEIQSINLPLTPPNIENFLVREFGLIFEFDATDNPGIKFNLTSLKKISSPVSVPYPESDDDFLLGVIPAIVGAIDPNKCKSPTLTFPGKTFTCGLTSSIYKEFYIDDSDVENCDFKIVERLYLNRDNMFSVNVAEIPLLPIPDSSTLLISLGFPDDAPATATECSTSQIYVAGRKFSSRLIALPNRTLYTVTGSVSATPRTVTYSDFTFTPQ